MDDMREQRFGVEIELTGITRNRAAEVIASYFGTAVRYEGTYYDTHTATDRQGRTWKCMTDNSIACQRKIRGGIVAAGRDYSTEVVTPILGYADIEDLQEVVRRLRKAGAFSNSSCGIHIHIDSAPHTPKTLVNLVNLMSQKEDVLYRALKVNIGRERFCKKTNQKLISSITSRKPKTIANLADLWYADHPDPREHHYNNSRYYGLNLHSTFQKGTIEFRCFNSTTHAGEIKAYVQFCLALSYKALTTQKALSRKIATNNDKYLMRCWLLRLGLIGDEFKSCRRHLTKNLEGDSAFRYGRNGEFVEAFV